MTKVELKRKCEERAKIFQQAMENCHSSSPMDCIEWFADRIAELEAQNKWLEGCNSELAEHLGKANDRITELEKENKELKAQIEEMKCWHKMDYNDKESCKKIPQGIQLLTEYDCGLFVAYCVNRWTGDHWEEHRYGITRWKEIKENDRK